jgi:hypothetical protein
MVGGPAMKYLLSLLLLVTPLEATLSGSISGASYKFDETVVTFPILVQGSNGTGANSKAVKLNIPTVPTAATKLRLRLHGIEFPEQASVQVNTGAKIAITNSNFTCPDPWVKAYGCLMEGEHTLWVEASLASGLVKQGLNTITFFFNKTDGNNSGYRVLGIQILDGNGKALIPASQFQFDDPATYKATTGNPANGLTLFQTATLVFPTAQKFKDKRFRQKTIRGTATAHCADCHDKLGRDLAIFNYENESIYSRSRFHGLSDSDSNDIVAYIRSLSATNGGSVTYCPNGRPWNPAYQPGPGMDSVPIQCWTAGAGVDAALNSDEAMYAWMDPTGNPSDGDPNRSFNIRETPIPIQFLDWNHLLPAIHPNDAYPTANFLGSQFYKDYVQLSNTLTPRNGSAYASMKYVLSDWELHRQQWFSPLYCHSNCGTKYTDPKYTNSVYGVPQWQWIKQWELLVGNSLEDMPQSVFSPPAIPDVRAWPNGITFRTSVSIIQIPPPSGGSQVTNGIEDGTIRAFNRVSQVWYLLQMVLNTSQHQQLCDHPVDFGYMQGFIHGMAATVGNNGKDPLPAQAVYGMSTYVTRKGLEANISTANDPKQGCNTGFQPGSTGGASTDLSLYYQTLGSVKLPIWGSLSNTQRNNMLMAVTQAYVKYLDQWYKSNYFSGGMIDNTGVTPGGWYMGDLQSRIAYNMPRYKTWTGDTATTQRWNDIANDWWPALKCASTGGTNCPNTSTTWVWKNLLTTTCTGTSNLSCGTD